MVKYAERIAQEGLSTEVSGATPMDIGALHNQYGKYGRPGKGKNKDDKGKGKGDWKGKHKGKEDWKGDKPQQKEGKGGNKERFWCKHCGAMVRHKEDKCWWKPKENPKGDKGGKKGAKGSKGKGISSLEQETWPEDNNA